MKITLQLVALLALALATGMAHGECVPGSSSQTFNASQDLHKVKVGGVQYYDLKPNDSKLDATPRLNAAISYVTRNSDCTQLVVDPGTYYFQSLASNGKDYVTVQNTSKSFDFRNASFLFKESYFTAFDVSNCNQCSFSRVSIDYVHLPFTQLKVTNVPNNNQSIVVEPQTSSWPGPQQLYTHQSQFGEVTLYGFDTRAGMPQYGYSRWQIATPLARDHRLSIDTYGVIKPGDVFIVSARGGGPAIRIENSGPGTFKDITIHTSAGPGVETWYSQGISLIGITIVPRGITSGGATGPSNFLVSTVAGGIELDAIAGPGNLVSHSVIQSVQDDSIAGNLAASNGVLYSASENSVKLCEGQTAPSGQTFLVNIDTGAAVGSPLSTKQYVFTSTGSDTYSVSPAFTAREASDLLPGAAIYRASQFSTPDYVTIENNQISNSYLARGIAFSGVGAMRITNNTLTNIEQAGIYVGTSLPTNGPVMGARIAGNHLTQTNLGMSGVGTGMLGAIEVMSFAFSGQAISTQPSQKIFISGNTVSGTQRAGIWIANVEGGSIESNLISDYGQSGTNLGIDPHLNFGVESYVKEAFQQEVLGWCDRNVSGITLPMCNLELQSAAIDCLELPGESDRSRNRKRPR